MKGFLRKGCLVLLGLLCLGVVSFLFLRVLNSRSDSDLSAHALVLPPLPEDRAAAMLDQFGGMVQTSPERYPDYRQNKREDLIAFRAQYSESLAAFWEWYDHGGRQALAPQTEAPKRARFPVFDWINPNDRMPIIKQRRLTRLLLVHAFLEYEDGRLEEGRRALTASFEIGRFMLQNPDMLLALLAFPILEESQYFLSELAPAFERTLDWSPLLADRALFLDVWHKAFWLSTVGLNEFAADLNTELGNKSVAFRFLTYSEGHMRNTIARVYETFERDIAGPLDDADFDYFGADKPFNAFAFNPAGRYRLAEVFPRIENMVGRHALTTARGDILRVRLALLHAGLPWQRDHVLDQIETMGLRNPFSGQPYQVEPNGNIVVFAPTAPHWRRLDTAIWPTTGMAAPHPLAADRD